LWKYGNSNYKKISATSDILWSHFAAKSMSSCFGNETKGSFLLWQIIFHIGDGNFLNINIAKLYFVSKIVLTYCKKKLFLWPRKTFKNRGWKPRICKNFEITRTFFFHRERSVQFLKKNVFLTCFWRLEQFEFKLLKIIGIWKLTGKVRKNT